MSEENRHTERRSRPVEFRFSVRRMLLFMVLLSAWLAGLRVLPEPWLVWLTTAVFYVAVVLAFSPRRKRPARAAALAGDE